MSTKKEIESDFYFYAKMAGLEQQAPDRFAFNGRRYTANAMANETTAKAFGGKARAYKLLRHASLIQHIAATPEGENVAGIVAKSFDAVSQQYPMLRSYYEGTMIGGTHHAWFRYRN